MKKLAIALVLSALQISCTGFDAAQNNVVVKKSCGKAVRCFEKIQSAIDAAPAQPLVPYKIYIASGDYREKLIIAKNNVQLLGQDSKKTRIIFDDYAGRELTPGKTLSTPGSATLTIKASDIRVENITIENGFDFLANDALPADNSKKTSGSQAVAMFIDAPSDRVLLKNSILLGYQDTLFVNSGRSWFDKVLVAGNVDYIFGNGNALFTDSEIKTRVRGKPINPHGFVTAPSTQLASTYGLTFLNCRLTRDQGVPDNTVSLGRPWHPTTQFSDGRYADPNAVGKSVFINTWMDAHITQDGWYAMSGNAKEGGRKSFLPEDARFFEYKTQGAGATVNEKRRQLNAEEIKKYTQEKILGDWYPH
jgi:pectinesterase